jgi:hypothetical protein
LVLIVGFIYRSETIKRTAYFIFILGALFTIPSVLTGDGAAHVVKKVPDLGKGFIKKHHEAADTFAILSYILGGLSLIGLWASWKQKSYAKLLAYGIGTFSLAVIFYSLETANTGGEVRHTEIRSDNNLDGPYIDSFDHNQDLH